MKTTLRQAQTPAKVLPVVAHARNGADEHVLEAHRQADHDIELDPDFMIHSHTHDLDEGEIARLGED